MKWRIIVKQDGRVYTYPKFYDMEKRHLAAKRVRRLNQLKDTDAYLEPVVEPSD